MEPNFRKIYLTNPYDFMLEILFRKSLFFWYMKILLRSFSFWDIENVKPKFQPRCAYKLYAYKKWSVWNVKKGNWLLWKLIFETFLPNLFSSLLLIRKNNFRKAFFSVCKNKFRKITWKLNYFENLKTLPCPRTPPHLWMVSPTEYFLCLINPLTHFKPMFHLCWKRVVDLHAEYPP